MESIWNKVEQRHMTEGTPPALQEVDLKTIYNVVSVAIQESEDGRIKVGQRPQIPAGYDHVNQKMRREAETGTNRMSYK